MKDWLLANLPNIWPIGAGVLVGSSAHFGQMIARGERPPLSMVIGFTMQLGLIGLVAAMIVDLAGIESPLMASFTASVVTLAANEVINWMRGRAAGMVRKLDAVTGLPDPKD